MAVLILIFFFNVYIMPGEEIALALWLLGPMTPFAVGLSLRGRFGAAHQTHSGVSWQGRTLTQGCELCASGIG